MADEVVSDPTLACPHGSIVMELTPRGVTFSPSPKRVARMAWMLFFVAVAFPIILIAAVLLFEPGMADSAAVSLVAFGVIVTGSCAIGAAWYRYSSVTPLLVEPTGRVSYGTKVLLEVGASPSFHIESREGGGEDASVISYYVVATNRWGPLVRFPSPWFDEFADLAVAEWFARQLEAAIGAKAKAKAKASAPTPGEPGRSASLEFGFERQDDPGSRAGELR